MELAPALFHRVDAVALLRTMLLAREGDRREGLLMRQGHGFFQVGGAGHEPLAALAALLQPDDVIFPSYRDRALMLARGVTPAALARDFFALAGAESGGRSMPGHYSARDVGVFSVASPTGSQCLPAVGAAWALKERGTDALVLCNLGDGAARQGELYEAFCQAVQDRLPVLFLIEDNGYAISTSTADMLPMRLGVWHEDWVVRFCGCHAADVYEAAAPAVERARRGDGPSLLWCELDRLCSHTSADDHRGYRPAEELAAIEARDPIELLARDLVAAGELSDAELADLRRSVVDEIEAVYQAVIEEPPPDPARVLDHVYGPYVTPPPLPLSSPSDGAEPVETMVQAVNHTLHAALAQWPEMLMFGEDIADPKGGVFGYTQGLSTAYPGRVRNSPLAEATIVGTAGGLAALGYRPVFELQFIDFMTPGFHQLATQVANLRWRSEGKWTCPLVFYAPYGAYLPAGGIWHSQSNEGWWAHLPGLRVAVPSTPADAAGLLWTAIAGDDPTLVLLPKHLCRQRMVVPAYEPVLFGQAAVRRPGDDVTVVAWGNTVELAEQAADLLADEGIAAEVIDLRTVVPCDWAAIEASLVRTGRLVVIQEDSKTCGFGQAVISEMTTVPERFDLFLAPPQLVSRPDVPVPFHPALEAAVMPSLDDVLAAIRLTMDR